ncbi:hypothetical protein BH09VER1_BH09VER1_39950 [soil metagenome]
MLNLFGRHTGGPAEDLRREKVLITLMLLGTGAILGVLLLLNFSR